MGEREEGRACCSAVFLSAETLFLGKTGFIFFFLKADALLVSPLTAGHCYTRQLSPFPEVTQALVLGSEESSPGSLRLFGALYSGFSPHFISEVFAFSVPRLERISKLQGQEAAPSEKLWAASSRWPCLSRVLGRDDLQSSCPTTTIL